MCSYGVIMPQDIRKIRDTIAIILNTDEKRASLLVRDDITIILLDCDVVGMSALSLITEQFPHVSIATIASEHSASGYIVIFTCMPVGSMLTSAHTFHIVACLVLFVAVLTSPICTCWKSLM
jgi:hypothetical protein